MSTDKKLSEKEQQLFNEVVQRAWVKELKRRKLKSTRIVYEISYVDGREPTTVSDASVEKALMHARNATEFE